MAHKIEESWTCEACGRRWATKPDDDSRHLVQMRIEVNGLGDSNAGSGIVLANARVPMVCQRLSCLLRAAVSALSERFGASENRDAGEVL